MNGRAVRRLKPLFGSAVGLGVSYALPVVFGAALGTSVVYLAIRPQWGDQTWLLFAARRMLDGAGLHFDSLAESNPPLIIWLSAIPVMIGRALHLGLPVALQGCLVLLVGVTLAWSLLLLRRLAADGPRFAAWFAPVLLFATVMHPWLHHGQREHLILLLLLPYLVIAAGRLDGAPPPARAAVLAGLCAGLGALLKPPYFVVIVAVELLLLARGCRLRSLCRGEAMALLALALAYPLAVVVWAPDYFDKVLPMALGTYYDYHRADLAELMPPLRALKVMLVVMLWAVLYRSLAWRSLATVLLLAGLGSTAACLIQLKGHEYHFVPAIGFFDLMVGVIAVDRWLQWSSARTLQPGRGRAAAATMVSFAVAAALCLPLHINRATHPYTDERIAVQRALGNVVPTGATVLILSTSVESIFEQVLDRDWEWGSRFFCLWMVPGIVTAGASDPAAYRDAALLTRNALSDDLVRWHPNPVLVDRCQDATLPACMGASGLRIDLLQWLKQDRHFTEVWTGYVQAGQVGPYDLWCLKEDGDICRRILAGAGALKAARLP